ncbi:MAG: hypothetical protein ABI759_21025 [Candidatus Solibacter sp.]
MTIRTAPVAATFLLAAVMTAQDRTAATECVIIHTSGDYTIPAGVLLSSRQTTQRIFKRAGFRIVFTSSKVELKRSKCIPIQVEFTAKEPAGNLAHSLAYALPFQDGSTQIRVFLARVLRSPCAIECGIRLGYVLSHEIGHVLEGIDYHSEKGVMKTAWEKTDFAQMGRDELAFHQDDVELMHAGAAAKLRRSLEARTR